MPSPGSFPTIWADHGLGQEYAHPPCKRPGGHPIQFFPHDDGSPTDSSSGPESQIADVAQLVAHHLAKVRVAGSNPVVRSTAAAFRSWVEFHSIHAHGGVAEWFRQGPAKPCTRVRFPSPPRAISSAGERYLDTVEVTGSIPVSRTNNSGPCPNGTGPFCCRIQSVFAEDRIRHPGIEKDRKAPPRVRRPPTPIGSPRSVEPSTVRKTGKPCEHRVDRFVRPHGPGMDATDGQHAAARPSRQDSPGSERPCCCSAKNRWKYSASSSPVGISSVSASKLFSGLAAVKASYCCSNACTTSAASMLSRT